MGAPGSGKGTYGVKLSKDLNLPYIETGNIIRDLIKENKDPKYVD